MDEYSKRLLAERREREASLGHFLKRFVMETGKGIEFLSWLKKDMGLDKPIPDSPFARYMTANEMADMETATSSLDNEIKETLAPPHSP